MYSSEKTSTVSSGGGCAPCCLLESTGTCTEEGREGVTGRGGIETVQRTSPGVPDQGPQDLAAALSVRDSRSHPLHRGRQDGAFDWHARAAGWSGAGQARRRLPMPARTFGCWLGTLVAAGGMCGRLDCAVDGRGLAAEPPSGGGGNGGRRPCDGFPAASMKPPSGDGGNCWLESTPAGTCCESVFGPGWARRGCFSSGWPWERRKWVRGPPRTGLRGAGRAPGVGVQIRFLAW